MLLERDFSQFKNGEAAHSSSSTLPTKRTTRNSAIFPSTISFPWSRLTSARRRRHIRRIHGCLNKSIMMSRCCTTRTASMLCLRSWKIILLGRHPRIIVPGISRCCESNTYRRSWCDRGDVTSCLSCGVFGISNEQNADKIKQVSIAPNAMLTRALYQHSFTYIALNSSEIHRKLRRHFLKVFHL